jgi:hypothetical protein
MPERSTGPKREEETGWRRYETIYNLYFPPNIIRVIKLRRQDKRNEKQLYTRIYIYFFCYKV